MIEAFGGRVTGSISGRTDILIVGKDPGMAKVMEAEASAKCKLISLKDLKEVFEGGCLEEAARKPLAIPAFSEGYPGAKRITASSTSTAVVVNANPDADKKPAAKRKRSEDDGGKKPAAKKRNAKALAAKKKATKKTSEATPVEEKENVDNDDHYTITCDLCKVDCTGESWHVEATEEDFCADCRDGRGVPQCNGVNV
jgi:hypothetical protein